MCLYPQLVKNPKYRENKKNGGQVPPVNDPRVLYVPIGCGDCIECRKQKAATWQIRLQEEIKQHTNGKFITLTFSDQSIQTLIQNPKQLTALRHLKDLKGYTLDNQIATTATRLFLERHRKKYKKALRHFLITELGHDGTENVHLHGIVWTDNDLENIEKLWTYGYVWKGQENCTPNGPKRKNYVTARTVNYIIKYITKKDEKHKTYKGIILVSPGIGKNYTNSYNARQNRYTPNNTNDSYKTPTGHTMSLPTYYRNKIYTDEEREKLWLEKLDQNTRYICGEKVPFKTKSEIDNYFRLLKYHQQRNKKLGYGDGRKTWEQVKYEKEQRELQYSLRIERATARKEPKASDGGPAVHQPHIAP